MPADCYKVLFILGMNNWQWIAFLPALDESFSFGVNGNAIV